MINSTVLQRAKQIRDDLAARLRGYGLDADESCGSDVADLQRAICAAFFETAAQRTGRSYRSIFSPSELLTLSPSSVVVRRPPDWLVYRLGQSSGIETMIEGVCKIEASWLPEIAPHFFRQRSAKEMNEADMEEGKRTRGKDLGTLASLARG